MKEIIMVSVFKKTVLTVTMLGCVFGAQAAENKKNNTTIARFKNGLAQVGVGLGTAAMLNGVYGFNCPNQTSLYPINSSWSKADIFADIFIPAIVITGASAIYLLSSAKNWKNRAQATLATGLTVFGSLVLTGGALSLVNEMNVEGFGTLGVAAFGVGVTALGCYLQPNDAIEPQK